MKPKQVAKRHPAETATAGLGLLSVAVVEALHLDPTSGWGKVVVLAVAFLPGVITFLRVRGPSDDLGGVKFALRDGMVVTDEPLTAAQAQAIREQLGGVETTTRPRRRRHPGVRG